MLVFCGKMSVMRGFFVGLTVGMMLAVFVPLQARAQAVPPTCDANFHDVLRSKAWMEAQREVEIAETIMSERPSVLDYTCFKNRVDAFAGATVFGNNASKTAAGTQSLQNYVNNILSGASLSCRVMSHIWETVRCSDANKTEWFRDLEDFVYSDGRPSCGAAAGNRNDQWDAANRIVYPLSFRPVSSGGYDRVDAFLRQMDPANCGSSAYVRTGITLARSGLQDGVCLAPGCYVSGSGCN